jgi:uncharacterized membrane protein
MSATSIVREHTSDDDVSEQPLRKRSAPQVVRSAHIINEQIDVGVPHDVAFQHWSNYDKWSAIFKNETARSGSNSVSVTAQIGPSRRTWESDITDVEQDRRISWRSKGDVQAMGTTTFHSLDDRLTRLMVEIEYRPNGFVELIGNVLRMQRRRVRRDLRLFKNYVELHAGGGSRSTSGTSTKRSSNSPRASRNSQTTSRSKRTTARSTRRPSNNTRRTRS